MPAPDPPDPSNSPESSNPTDAVVRRRTRLGAATLVLAGFLSAVLPFLVGGAISAPEGGRVITVESAVRANSLAWRAGMALTFCTFASLILGAFALYAHLARTRAERWALAGLVVTVGSLVVYLPLLGVAAYAVPAAGALIAGGQADAIAVIDRTWTDPFIFLPFVGGILENVGVALFGVAVRRSETLSKAGGAGLFLAGVLGVPAFLDVVQLRFVAQFLLAAGLVVVGASLWRVAGRAEPSGG